VIIWKVTPRYGPPGLRAGSLAEWHGETARCLLIRCWGLRRRLIGQRLLRACHYAQAIADRTAERHTDGEQGNHADDDRENLPAAEAVLRLRLNLRLNRCLCLWLFLSLWLFWNLWLYFRHWQPPLLLRVCKRRLKFR
jgi:hypothetical protein